MHIWLAHGFWCHEFQFIQRFHQSPSVAAEGIGEDGAVSHGVVGDQQINLSILRVTRYLCHQTWLAGKALQEMELSMGKTSINGGYSPVLSDMACWKNGP